MAERKKLGRGDRRQERGTGQAGRDQQGSKAQLGHPASWQRPPVTSWQGRGDGRQGERGMQDTGVFVYLIRGGKEGGLRTRQLGSCDLLASLWPHSGWGTPREIGKESEKTWETWCSGRSTI